MKPDLKPCVSCKRLCPEVTTSPDQHEPDCKLAMEWWGRRKKSKPKRKKN